MIGKQYKNQSYLVKVGKRLAAIREEKKITQEKLQELTGFDARRIGGIERTENIASISIIKHIAECLYLKLATLVMCEL